MPGGGTTDNANGQPTAGQGLAGKTRAQNVIRGAFGKRPAAGHASNPANQQAARDYFGRNGTPAQPRPAAPAPAPAQPHVPTLGQYREPVQPEPEPRRFGPQGYGHGGYRQGPPSYGPFGYGGYQSEPQQVDGPPPDFNRMNGFDRFGGYGGLGGYGMRPPMFGGFGGYGGYPMAPQDVDPYRVAGRFGGGYGRGGFGGGYGGY